ncbi:hypothetical protein AMTR_s00072p00052960 [Amborella trichopoda]|uniref:Uncharacterized protein n=1 Tax=Amborella trichopoda TaxID=13333 RepID=W1NS10_AMBTC|nr:hypothetical protein AMTR_s00072p00052960 [Amborella trichopoda]
MPPVSISGAIVLTNLVRERTASNSFQNLSPIIYATSLARGSCEQRSLKQSSITASCRARAAAMMSSKVGQIRGPAIATSQTQLSIELSS